MCVTAPTTHLLWLPRASGIKPKSGVLAPPASAALSLCLARNYLSHCVWTLRTCRHQKTLAQANERAALGTSLQAQLSSSLAVTLKSSCLSEPACVCVCVCVRTRSGVCDSATRWTVASQAPPGQEPGQCSPHCPWDSPGTNTGVGCHFLLQRIFPTQGSNPCLLPQFPLLQVAAINPHPTLLLRGSNKTQVGCSVASTQGHTPKHSWR